MKKLSALLLRLFEFSATIGAFGLIAIAVMITTDVLVRWISSRPITGVFEFSGVLLVMVTFLPLGLVLFTNQQLRIDIIQQYVKGRVAAGFGLIDAAIGLLVFGLLLLVGTEETLKAYNGRFLLRGMIEIPTWIPNAMICAGALFAVLAHAFQTVDYVRSLIDPDANRDSSGKE